jgi:hypothetical protein
VEDVSNPFSIWQQVDQDLAAKNSKPNIPSSSDSSPNNSEKASENDNHGKIFDEANSDPINNTNNSNGKDGNENENEIEHENSNSGSNTSTNNDKQKAASEDPEQSRLRVGAIFKLVVLLSFLMALFYSFAFLYNVLRRSYIGRLMFGKTKRAYTRVRRQEHDLV